MGLREGCALFLLPIERAKCALSLFYQKSQRFMSPLAGIRYADTGRCAYSLWRNAPRPQHQTLIGKYVFIIKTLCDTQSSRDSPGSVYEIA